MNILTRKSLLIILLGGGLSFCLPAWADLPGPPGSNPSSTAPDPNLETSPTVAAPSPQTTQIGCPVPLNQPDKPHAAVLAWANEAIVAVNSYNFVNYNGELQKASDYFTVPAWQEYKKALDKSNVVAEVAANKLVVSAVATDSPVIIEEGVSGDRYMWKVAIPVMLTFHSANRVKKQYITAKMTIIRTPPAVGVRGLAIQRISVTQSSLPDNP